jgi:hypothetical protein
MEELVFIYYRFTSFESMGNGYFENVETKCKDIRLKFQIYINIFKKIIHFFFIKL